MQVPLTFDPEAGTPLLQVGSLDSRLRGALESQGIRALFPVQTAVWRATAGGRLWQHDICLAAPTGSGKTLAFLLPVAQALALAPAPPVPGRPFALAVLPTRDLAAQVFEQGAALCAAVGCSAQLLGGASSTSVAEEARALLGEPCGLLVATPGRLVQHLFSTPGFSLSDLRVLVVDEADRLLRQSYHEWLDAVLERLPPAPSMIKIVASATLTQDPGKLARLALRAPRFVALRSESGRGPQRYGLPAGLTAFKCPVPGSSKPAALVALLNDLAHTPTIVFASTLGACATLFTFLRALPRATYARPTLEFSSSQAPQERAAALAALTRPDSPRAVLVCSDAMTRGMDVLGVGAVVNYDVPLYPKVYVHRAGRTARAGVRGEVFSLVRPEDEKHFKLVLRKVHRDAVPKRRVDFSDVGLQVARTLHGLGRGRGLDGAGDAAEAGDAAAPAPADSFGRAKKRRLQDRAVALPPVRGMGEISLVCAAA